MNILWVIKEADHEKNLLTSLNFIHIGCESKTNCYYDNIFQNVKSENLVPSKKKYAANYIFLPEKLIFLFDKSFGSKQLLFTSIQRLKRFKKV